MPINSNQAPANVIIQYSDDDSEWTDAKHFTVDRFPGGRQDLTQTEDCIEKFFTSVQLDNPVKAKYWRLFIVDNQGHPYYIAILELRFVGY